MEVDEVVIIVKIINLDAAFRRAIGVFYVIVVMEVSDVVEIAARWCLGPGGAVSSWRFDLSYGVYFVKYVTVGAAPGPVRSKVICLWCTVLDGAGADSRGLVLRVTVNARVSGAGDVTATDAASAGQ